MAEDDYVSSFLPEFVKDEMREAVRLKADLLVMRQVWKDEVKVGKSNAHYNARKGVVLINYFCGDGKQNDGREDITDHEF